MWIRVFGGMRRLGCCPKADGRCIVFRWEISYPRGLCGSFRQLGFLVGSPYKQDHSILMSVFGSSAFGKLPCGYHEATCSPFAVCQAFIAMLCRGICEDNTGLLLRNLMQIAITQEPYDLQCIPIEVNSLAATTPAGLHQEVGDVLQEVGQVR